MQGIQLIRSTPKIDHTYQRKNATGPTLDKENAINHAIRHIDSEMHAKPPDHIQ